MGDGMKEALKTAFSVVVECPTCGAPLKVTNLTQYVVRTCSEDPEHYSHETRRANNPVVITDALTGEFIRDKAEAEDFAVFVADAMKPITAKEQDAPVSDLTMMGLLETTRAVRAAGYEFHVTGGVLNARRVHTVAADLSPFLRDNIKRHKADLLAIYSPAAWYREAEQRASVVAEVQHE